MTVRASFTFRNQGGASATGVRVRFNLPDGLVYLVGSGQLDGTELDDEHGNSPLLARAGADIGDVAPGEERRIEVAYSVAGAIENGSMVELQAAVAAFELAPVGSNIVRLVARSRPTLDNALTAAAIESRQHEPRPGGEATVTVRVHNAGESSAHDVVVVAPVPEHTAYVPNSARVNGRELERDLLAPFDHVHAPVIAHTLPASATVTLQYRVRIDDPLPDGTNLAVRAQIASQETAAFDLEPVNAVRSRGSGFRERSDRFFNRTGRSVAGCARAASAAGVQRRNDGRGERRRVVRAAGRARARARIRARRRKAGARTEERKRRIRTRRRACSAKRRIRRGSDRRVAPRGHDGAARFRRCCTGAGPGASSKRTSLSVPRRTSQRAAIA